MNGINSAGPSKQGRLTRRCVHGGCRPCSARFRALTLYLKLLQGVMIGCLREDEK